MQIFFDSLSFFLRYFEQNRFFDLEIFENSRVRNFRYFSQCAFGVYSKDIVKLESKVLSDLVFPGLAPCVTGHSFAPLRLGEIIVFPIYLFLGCNINLPPHL